MILIPLLAFIITLALNIDEISKDLYGDQRNIAPKETRW